MRFRRFLVYPGVLTLLIVAQAALEAHGQERNTALGPAEWVSLGRKVDDLVRAN